MAVLRTQAAIHEQNRLESVSEVLGLVALMTLKKVLNGQEAVDVRGAVYQWGEGVKSHNTVGAHCLPGQVTFNGQALDCMKSWTVEFLREKGVKPLQLSSKLRNLCARTDIVDCVVNNTDSLLEKMTSGRGLKPRYAGAVRQVMQRAVLQNPQTAAAMGELVNAGMSYYRLGAGLACEERLDGLRQKLVGALAGSNAENNKRGVAVTERYLEVLQDQSFRPWFSTSTGMMQLLSDVVA
jgi:hypothetical protein